MTEYKDSQSRSLEKRRNTIGAIIFDIFDERAQKWSFRNLISGEDPRLRLSKLDKYNFKSESSFIGSPGRQCDY